MGDPLRDRAFQYIEATGKASKKKCLAEEAHVIGGNDALTVTNKAHKKQWYWPFAPDSRQEIIHSLGNEDSSDCVKRVNNKMAIANQ